MEKNEFVKNFINLLINNKFEEMYKYFTNRTVIVKLDTNENMLVGDFIQYLDDTFRNEIIMLGRFLESKLCIKQELKSEKFKYDSILFEIKDRRFSRIELF